MPSNATPCGSAQVKISDKHVNRTLKLVFENAREHVYLIRKCSFLCLTYTSNFVVTKQLLCFILGITVYLYTVVQLVEALHYKKVAGSIPDGVIGFFFH